MVLFWGVSLPLTSKGQLWDRILILHDIFFFALFIFSSPNKGKKNLVESYFFSLRFFSKPNKRKKMTSFSFFFLFIFFFSTFFPPYFPRSKQGLKKYCQKVRFKCRCKLMFAPLFKKNAYVSYHGSHLLCPTWRRGIRRGKRKQTFQHWRCPEGTQIFQGSKPSPPQIASQVKATTFDSPSFTFLSFFHFLIIYFYPLFPRSKVSSPPQLLRNPPPKKDLHVAITISFLSLSFLSLSLDTSSFYPSSFPSKIQTFLSFSL